MLDDTEIAGKVEIKPIEEIAKELDNSEELIEYLHRLP